MTLQFAIADVKPANNNGGCAPRRGRRKNPPQWDGAWMESYPGPVAAAWAYRSDPCLTRADQAVILTLLRSIVPCAGEDPWTIMSLATIAERSAISRRAVMDSIAALESRGYLSVHRSVDEVEARQVNAYRLRVPALRGVA